MILESPRQTPLTQEDVYKRQGKNCRIYQNVTIGEVERRAPAVGDNCLIGAGAVLIGGIRIGDNVKIGAGAVVHTDVPDNCTMVPPPARDVYKRQLQSGAAGRPHQRVF